MVAAQAGDPEARTEVLERYRPLLVRLCRQYGWGDWEDLWQEASCQLLQLVDEYDSTGGVYFGRYLKTKLGWRISNYRRHIRQTTREDAPLDDPLIGEKPTPGPDEGERLIVREALALLSARQRSVLVRWYWYDDAAETIASDLGITPRAVRALKQRGERRLWELLAG